MLEKQCRNLLHAEWVNQYNGCDSDISTLKQVKVSERNAFESLNGKKIRIRGNMQVLVCQFCLDLLYSLYPNTIVNSETPPLFEHDYASETPKRPKRRRLLEIPDNIDQEVSSEPDIAGMGEGEFQKIVFEVGQRLASSTGIPKQQEHKSAEGLKKLDLETYFKSFDPSLCCLLEGFTSGKKRRDPDLYKKAKVAEYFVHLLHPNTILSLCFMENLLMYNATNSKQAVNLLGDSGPYGHYHAVKDWLSNQSMEPLPYPENDCVAKFDNNQVKGRSWKIKVNNKVQSSVVTTICQIEYPSYSLQRR